MATEHEIGAASMSGDGTQDSEERTTDRGVSVCPAVAASNATPAGTVWLPALQEVVWSASRHVRLATPGRRVER